MKRSALRVSRSSAGDASGYTSVMATVEQSETTVVTLTARAAEKISGLMAQEPAGEAEVLRVAIQGGGCSGFEYALGFDRGTQAGDHELEFHGVKVVVDPFSAPYLPGSPIDFLEGLQESGFKIDNPNVVSSCGCGSSFQVADAEADADDGCGSCGHAH
jgi:iron-sulfur cluster assembly accessory protein